MFIREHFLLLLSTIAVVGAIQCFNTTQDGKGSKCKAIKIGCPENHVIYKPNLQAANQPCGSIDACYDRSVELMLDIADCYWKQSCTVQYPRSILFNCKKSPKSLSLHVFDWQCISNAEMTNKMNAFICQGPTDLGANVDHGIIRSHSEIPWRYDQTTFPPNPYEQWETRCRKTIHSRTGDRYLVSVDLNLIDHDNDVLSINGVEIKNSNYNKIIDEAVDIQFKQSKRSKGGSGFLICFRKLVPDERPSESTSACDSIKTQPDQSVIETDGKCTDSSDIFPLDEINDENFCENILSGKKSTGTKNTTDTQISPSNKTIVQDDFCSLCLAKKKVGKKCKRKCCQGNNQPKVCKRRKRKCPKGRKLNRLCSKCEKQTKCRKNFKKQCSKCCKKNPNILKKCKTRRGGRKGGKRRGRKRGKTTRG